MVLLELIDQAIGVSETPLSCDVSIADCNPLHIHPAG
jgi:hypothetical protein